MTEDLQGETPCGGCAAAPLPALPVSWSPAFGAYLCPNCRRRRTEAELAATEQANSAARYEQRMKASLASRLLPGRR